MYEFWYDQRHDAINHANDNNSFYEYIDKTLFVDQVRKLITESHKTDKIIVTRYDSQMNPLDVYATDTPQTESAAYIGVMITDVSTAELSEAAHVQYKSPKYTTDKQKQMLQKRSACIDCDEMFMTSDTYNKIIGTQDKVLNFVNLHINIPN